jgi:hypothetical protein
MSALRLSQSGEGTPWQKQRAAAEDARQAEDAAYRRRQEEKSDERYREGITRADRPKYEPNLKEDGRGLGGMMGGRVFPDGRIIYDDGTTNMPGPQSGGAGDPNLPAPASVQAQALVGQPAPGSRDGYVIPVTGETYPPGTVRLPKGEPAVAASAPVGASPAPAPAPVAQQVQAGAPAVAAPAPQAPQASVVAAPNASTVPRRANRSDPLEPDTVPYVRAAPPYVNVKEWVTAEGKRLQALAGGEGPTTDMRNKLAKARQVAPLVERELNNLNKLVQESGTEYLPTAAKAEMQTTYGNLLMQLKEMYGLGALQAKDIEMVEKLLTDPTSSGWNPLEAAYKGVTQKGVTSAQVAKVKQILRDGLIEAERNLGGDPTRVPEVSKTTGTSSYTSKSGVKVDW